MRVKSVFTVVCCMQLVFNFDLIYNDGAIKKCSVISGDVLKAKLDLLVNSSVQALDSVFLKAAKH